jgi:hypothetical protein
MLAAQGVDKRLVASFLKFVERWIGEMRNVGGRKYPVMVDVEFR